MNPKTVTKESTLLYPGLTPRKIIERINNWFSEEDKHDSGKQTVIDWALMKRLKPEMMDFVKWAISSGLLDYIKVETGKKRYKLEVYLEGSENRLPDRIRITRSRLFRDIESGKAKLE